VSHPGSIAWFAHHESRLAWRDWLAMMTAGGRWRKRTGLVTLIGFLAFLHLIALSMVGRFAGLGQNPDKTTLIVITATLLLSWSLMVSQGMESVTRVFYARSDLDLILSSPAPARRLFAVRIATMALSIGAMALLLSAPFINVLAVDGGARWLAAYGVIVAMATSAAALAVALTVALFRTIGAKRTRVVAQIVAAVVGAAFVIGLQVAAILSSETLSRLSVLQSKAAAALAPGLDSVAWWPARAALGDIGALAAVLAISLAMLAAAILAFPASFGRHIVAATGTTADGGERQLGAARPFRRASPARTLRRKEWTLIRRDPWLISQSLMQILYLLPPALLLWRSYDDGSALVLLIPVLVMAAGQLAGGLAWLAISGEDAPDLIASAPVAARAIVRAKAEAVMGGIVLVFAPFVFATALTSMRQAAVAAAGILVAAASATAIQLWFRTQAKRSQFRRRQTSSRVATFAEALSSITWAATAALAAADSILAAFPAVVAVVILAATWRLSPRPATIRVRRA
jgi:ABC-2 type transport system permease protein